MPVPDVMACGREMCVLLPARHAGPGVLRDLLRPEFVNSPIVAQSCLVVLA